VAEDKKAFVVYYDWEGLFEALDDNEQAGELILALFAFAKRGEIAEFTGALKMAFAMMSNQIGKDTEKWYHVQEKRREAIKKRWAKEKGDNTSDTNVYKCIETNTNEYKAIQTDTNDTVNVNANANVNANVNVDNNVINKSYSASDEADAPSKKSKRFKPPTVEEVRAYCEERRNGINAEAFIDYYATRGWKLGKDTMKDWKACIRTWERRQGYKPPKETASVPAQASQSDRSYKLDTWYDQAEAFDKMLEEQYGGGE
jgi:hypothetical protein